MPVSLNGAAARETVIPMRTANISRSTPSNHRKTWRIWNGACFAVELLAVFAQPLLALINYAAGSQLYSYILLVPFVSAFDLARYLASKKWLLVRRPLFALTYPRVTWWTVWKPRSSS